MLKCHFRKSGKETRRIDTKENTGEEYERGLGSDQLVKQSFMVGVRIQESYSEQGNVTGPGDEPQFRAFKRRRRGE